MLYIAFEGIDGCGKSTLSQALTENLTRIGVRARRLPFMARSDEAFGRFILRTFDARPRPRYGNMLESMEWLKLILFQCNAMENWRATAETQGIKWTFSLATAASCRCTQVSRTRLDRARQRAWRSAC